MRRKNRAQGGDTPLILPGRERMIRARGGGDGAIGVVAIDAAKWLGRGGDAASGHREAGRKRRWKRRQGREGLLLPGSGRKNRAERNRSCYNEG